MVFKRVNEAEFASFTMIAILVAALAFRTCVSLPLNSPCNQHTEAACDLIVSLKKENSFCVYHLVKMNMNSTLGSPLLALPLVML